MNSYDQGEDKKKKQKAALLTRETVGMTFLLFGAILLFITITGPYVFGSIGVAITAFFVGLVGFAVYPLLALLIYASIVLAFGKKPIPKKWLVRGGLLLLTVFLIVHNATSARFVGEGYGSYLGGCWNAASESLGGGTGGGVLLGLVVYPIRSVLSAAGAYVLFSLLMALALFFLLRGTPLKRFMHLPERRKAEPCERGSEVRTEGTRPYPPAETSFSDLSTPECRTIPAEETRTAPPAATVAPAAPTDDVRAASRKILYEGDPASSYRRNLIFNSDSQFNSYYRRTDAEGERSYPADASSARAAEGSYSDRYADRAETTRPSMPRKVTEERPVSSYSGEFDYPQTPSYRAPSVPAPETHDYYAHDVEPEEYSSAPNVADIRETPAAAPSPAALPETSVTPASPAPDADRVTGSYVPPQEDAPEDSRIREAQFRSIFSRRTEEGEAERPRFGFGDRGRTIEHAPEERAGEEPLRDSTRGRDTLRGRSDDGLYEAEEPLRDSTRGRDTLRDRSDDGLYEAEEPLRDSTRGRDTLRGRSDDGLYEAEEPLRDSARGRDTLRGRSDADLFEEDGEEEEDFSEETQEDLGTRSRAEIGLTAERGGRSAPAVPVPAPDLAPAPNPEKHVYQKYRRPSLDLLNYYDDTVTVPQEEIENNSSVIVETLAGFRVDAEVVNVRCGSAVTRYDIDIPRNIAVRMVIKRDAEIAMRLHARDGVNIYSNSEAGAISIEVPNSVRAKVGLRSVMEGEEYQNAPMTSLTFAIGKDVEGRNVYGNIDKMKHLLVAGSTGSGKSVCLNCLLISLIYKYSPEQLRLILIDPKRVEFAIYEGIPHLMINEIICDPQKAIAALNWAIKEMERRYALFEAKTRSGKNVLSLDEYNDSLTEDEEKLPKIVIVVDELADLMSVARKDIEDRIQRLAQKARAAGLHLVIATQRPSVDVITGVIKGNLPTRLAFRVIQEVDSRTILDESGAEKLLGNGDMLYRTEGMFNCLRVQGAFLSSKEIQVVINEIKATNEAYFDASVADYINKNEGESGGSGAANDDGGAVAPEYLKALAIVVKLGTASISSIQRKCSVGYNHAGKIIEWMEVMGYISPFDGAKARTVLLTKEEFEAKYGSLDQW